MKINQQISKHETISKHHVGGGIKGLRNKNNIHTQTTIDIALTFKWTYFLLQTFRQLCRYVRFNNVTLNICFVNV